MPILYHQTNGRLAPAIVKEGFMDRLVHAENSKPVVGVHLTSEFPVLATSGEAVITVRVALNPVALSVFEWTTPGPHHWVVPAAVLNQIGTILAVKERS